ncbi:hypothetical protein GGR51DRAFT_514300 [Nemania sp. FL0031]|nr:hypothetical protein GGR51DRAFT_514300 [Nemania sp. FL0031]
MPNKLLIIRNLILTSRLAGVDITLTLSVAWTATVPTSELSDSRTWVFRFVPSGEDPSSTSEEISSSIFIISDPDAASPFSTTVSSPAIDSTSPTPISNTSPVTTSSDPLVSTNPTTTTSAIVGTETMTTSQSSSGLSTGMRAGIGVGAGAGAVILFAFGWFLARYHGRKSSTTGTGVAKQRNPGPFRKAPHELDGTAPQTTHTNIFPETYYQHPVEVDSSQAYYR